MAIEVMHDGEPKWMGCEPCCLCKSKTQYWYHPNDVALCPACAEKSCDSDIPTKLEWLNANGAKERSPDWMPNVEKFASTIVIDQDLICMAKVVGVKGPAVQMLKKSVAQMILSVEREKSNQSAKLKSDHVQSLEYMVDVHEAREEGKSIPAPYSAPLMIGDSAAFVLPEDRVQLAVDVDSVKGEAVPMIAIEHVRRLLAGEDSRTRLIEFQLRTRVEGLRQELETYVQEGELA